MVSKNNPVLNSRQQKNPMRRVQRGHTLTQRMNGLPTTKYYNEFLTYLQEDPIAKDVATGRGSYVGMVDQIKPKLDGMKKFFSPKKDLEYDHMLGEVSDSINSIGLSDVDPSYVSTEGMRDKFRGLPSIIAHTVLPAAAIWGGMNYDMIVGEQAAYVANAVTASLVFLGAVPIALRGIYAKYAQDEADHFEKIALSTDTFLQDTYQAIVDSRK